MSKKLEDMLTRAKSTQASARIYPLYQLLQTERFKTENASEGAKWEPLNREYSAYKLRRYGGGTIKRGRRSGERFGAYPGAGTKMLIGTSTLAGAVIGPGSPFFGVSQHTALFRPYSMQITVNLSGVNAEGKPFNYPEYVAEKRPFMTFSPASISKMKETLQQYLIGK